MKLLALLMLAIAGLILNSCATVFDIAYKYRGGYYKAQPQSQK